MIVDETKQDATAVGIPPDQTEKEVLHGMLMQWLKNLPGRIQASLDSGETLVHVVVTVAGIKDVEGDQDSCLLGFQPFDQGAIPVGRELCQIIVDDLTTAVLKALDDEDGEEGK